MSDAIGLSVGASLMVAHRYQGKEFKTRLEGSASPQYPNVCQGRQLEGTRELP